VAGSPNLIFTPPDPRHGCALAGHIPSWRAVTGIGGEWRSFTVADEIALGGPIPPPLETAWAGRLFRSRVEARWAVFFDALGLPYDYEKDAYALPSGNYWPDFFLPGIDSFIEIKGVGASRREESLAHELAALTYKRVFIFGPPRGIGTMGEVFGPEDFKNAGYLWAECCHGPMLYGIEQPCSACGSDPKISDRIAAAHTAALSERFGH
jgi:hypothetical protein